MSAPDPMNLNSVSTPNTDTQHESAMRTFDELHPFDILTVAARVLVSDPDQAHPFILEALIPRALKEPNDERLAQHVLQQWAREQGQRWNASEETDLNQPIQRVLPWRRMLLTLASDLKLSYANSALWMGMSESQTVLELWKTRAELARPYTAPAAIPTSDACPEWIPERPWVQTYVDGFMPRFERVFVESHVLECDSCRAAVLNTRTMIQKAYMTLPPIPSNEAIAARRWLLIRETRDVRDEFKIVEERRKTLESLGWSARLKSWLRRRWPS